MLLVTDATFGERARGLDRTLKNLFAEYPPENLLICAAEEEIHANPPDAKWAERVRGVRTRFFPRLRNRVGALLEPLRRSFDFAMLARTVRRSAPAFRAYEPELLLVSATGLEMNLAGRVLAEELRCPVAFYAMDDHRDMDSVRWASGSGAETIGGLVEQASGRIYISENLARTYRERYKPESTAPELIVHNPVALEERNDPERLSARSGTFRLAYAGSIWQMHFDALEALAEAVLRLRSRGEDIELVLYTNPEFWKLHEKLWTSCEVKNGGFVPYSELTARLQEADLLVLASTFRPEFEHLAKASVQTKLTDYMAAGRPVLALGPEYAVCNRLLRTWDCAVFAETSDPEALAELLRVQSGRRKELRATAAKAFTFAREHFEIAKVQQNFYEFLAERCAR